jgi:hypothetical protein
MPKLIRLPHLSAEEVGMPRGEEFYEWSGAAVSIYSYGVKEVCELVVATCGGEAAGSRF